MGYLVSEGPLQELLSQYCVNYLVSLVENAASKALFIAILTSSDSVPPQPSAVLTHRTLCVSRRSHPYLPGRAVRGGRHPHRPGSHRHRPDRTV